MTTIRVLTETEIRSLVGIGEEELGAVQAVFPLVSRGVGSMPPIQRIDVPAHNGEIDIKSAYLPGFDGIAVKISAGFFDNPTLGLPSLGGLMLVFDARTGVPTAALFDNGYLTNVRTALAGAVAADHLARHDARIVGVVGAGVQARLQITALRLVRPIEEVRVWARRPEEADRLAAELDADLGITAVAVDSVSDAASEGAVLVTTTPATSPVVGTDVLRPGLHITAIGSDAEHKQELDTAVVEAADVFCCDSEDQSARLGELRALLESGRTRTVTELGEVIDGSTSGRVDDAQTTICDLSGTGAQDTAIASLVVERARATGTGTEIDPTGDTPARKD